MANVEGKATAITVVTPLRWRGPLVLWLVFWAGRNIASTLRKLQMLSFIHYARWAVIKRFPDEDGGERLHHTYLFFESNFNGTWDQYILHGPVAVGGEEQGALDLVRAQVAGKQQQPGALEMVALEMVPPGSTSPSASRGYVPCSSPTPPWPASRRSSGRAWPRAPTCSATSRRRGTGCGPPRRSTSWS